jgi:hypothetical protein
MIFLNEEARYEHQTEKKPSAAGGRLDGKTPHIRLHQLLCCLRDELGIVHLQTMGLWHKLDRISLCVIIGLEKYELLYLIMVICF